jgi:hypothetical protein
VTHDLLQELWLHQTTDVAVTLPADGSGYAEQHARGHREHARAPAAGGTGGRGGVGVGQEAVPVTVVPDLVTW